MFFYCEKLLEFELPLFNINNTINMSDMFLYYKNLINLDLSSFKIKNDDVLTTMFIFVLKFNFYFYFCIKFIYLY